MELQYSFNRNDSNYASAINYDGTNYYNAPMTLSVNDILFVLPFGDSDHTSVDVRGNEIYIIGENKRLDYVSMVVIDLSDNSVAECHVSGNDINDSQSLCYDIFEHDLGRQISILQNYLPY